MAHPTTSATIHCDVVSAQSMLFSGEVRSLVVCGASGDLGIHPRHAPLMTRLRPGPVRLNLADGDELIFFAGGGVLEVMPHMATVLADTAVRADDIDEAEAIRAKKRAERELRETSSRLELAEAEAHLLEALAKLRTVEELRRRIKRYRHPG
jgi:F-type H+-transporting ATPase subunit epsilon